MRNPRVESAFLKSELAGDFLERLKAVMA